MPKRRISAATGKRIAYAQRARWARVRDSTPISERAGGVENQKNLREEAKKRKPVWTTGNCKADLRPTKARHCVFSAKP
jgi:hypothetical protein